MRTWKRSLVVALVVVLLLFGVAVVAALALPAAPAAPAASYELTWQVLASGGQTMSSNSYTMLSTSGQAVAGPASSPSYSLLSGYWQSFQAAVQRILLPVILKQ